MKKQSSSEKRPSRVAAHPEHGSRFQFLEALSDLCPGMLQELKNRVYNPYEPVWSVHALQHTDLGTMRALAAQNKGVAQAMVALDLWATEHRLDYGWFLDAILWTVYGLQGTAEPRWCYLAGVRLELLKFEFGPWIPRVSGLGMERTTYARSARAAFDSALKSYLNLQEGIWSSGKDNLAAHARWAVQRFMGLSYEEIAEKWYNPNQFESGDPVMSIRRAVNRFAKRIGLKPLGRHEGGALTTRRPPA